MIYLYIAIYLIMAVLSMFGMIAIIYKQDLEWYKEDSSKWIEDNYETVIMLSVLGLVFPLTFGFLGLMYGYKTCLKSVLSWVEKR